MKIQVQKIIPNTVEHFDANDTSLGFLNQLESADLCCQIVENNIESSKETNSLPSGYYYIFNDKRVDLLNNGDYSHYPNGLWDELIHLMTRKIKCRRGVR